MYLLKTPHFKICCALLLLGFLLATLDLKTVFDRLALIDMSVICGSFMIMLIAVVVATLKFKLALPDLGLWPIFRTTFLLQFYNLFPVGQISGEVLRIVVLSTTAKQAPRIAAAAVFDRITGLIAVLISLIIALIAEPDRFGRSLTTIVLILALGTLIGIVIVTQFDDQWLRLKLFGHSLPAWLIDFVERCKSALKEFLGRPKIIVSSIVLGLVHQALIIASLAILGTSLSIWVSIATWTIAIGLSSIIMLIPVSFAGIGTRDLSFIALFGLAAIKPETAEALSVAALGLQVAAGIISSAMLILPAHFANPAIAHIEAQRNNDPRP